MKVGIEKTLDLFDELEKMCALGVMLARTGVGFGTTMKVLEIIKGANDLIKEAPQTVVELNDLDKEETMKLAERALEMVRNVMLAVRK